MAVSAAVLGADNKVISIVSDAIEAEFSFDTEGVSKTDKGQVVKTKLEKGADYGMAKDGAYDANQDGVVKEWYEQAAAFDAACVGKDAKGIAALEIHQIIALGQKRSDQGDFPGPVTTILGGENCSHLIYIFLESCPRTNIIHSACIHRAT
jgi:hypothetical protein